MCRTRHATNLDMWSYSFSQYCPFPLFWKLRLSSCCAGSTSSKIDAEDDFSSRKGGWWGHDLHIYDHAWRTIWRPRRSARVSKSTRRSEANSVRVPEMEAESNLSSSLPRPSGPVCLQLVTQDASRLCFRWSTYGWKANLIRKPIQVVSHQKTFRINWNSSNNSASRIC